MTKPKLLFVTILIFLILLALFLFRLRNPKVIGDQASMGVTSQEINKNLQTNTNLVEAQPTNSEQKLVKTPIEEVASNLTIPWEIVFLPDESLLVTQRPGTIVHITEQTQKTIEVSGVEHFGEGGLLGIVLHPEYQKTKQVYLYLTSKTEKGIQNRVERYVFDETKNSLTQKQVILDNIPGAIFHDGGRISFGPDNYLYITTGDAGNPDSAQDIHSLSGKILRTTDDGSTPQDNPYNNLVYSFGHRNPQGLAWDTLGNLWATEHGPSVTTTGLDEVNLIVKGKNYGWPVITGNTSMTGMVSPILQSGSQVTWAPGDTAIHNSMLFFTGLKGEGLYSAEISGTKLINFRKHFDHEYGRLRALSISPDQHWLYISTSNQDGRGTPDETDDKIIKINFSVFE